MEKLIFIFFTFFYSINSYSGEGIIIVFEAPLLKEKNLNSKVYQVLKKGDHLFIPDEIISNFNNHLLNPEFIESFDRAGNTVYIPFKYVKLITNQQSEYKQNINYEENDPTDFRIEEPIPTTYPYDDTTKNRIAFSFIFGTNSHSPYENSLKIYNESKSLDRGIKFNYLNRANFDKFDRIYFGVTGSISSTTHDVKYENAITSIENRSVIKFGPILTFDFFKGEKFKISSGTGFTVNFHKSSIKNTDTNQDFELRNFSGLSMSPFISNSFIWSNVVPLIDFYMGQDLNLNLPFIETTNSTIENTSLWQNNGEDFLKNKLSLTYAFNIGVQIRY